MKPFISQITDYLLAQEQPLHQWIIVVPSQRSIRYIQKSLFEKVKKPILSPKIISIDKLFESISPRIILDKTRLLLELYSIHAQHSSAENKSFDEFFTWGKTLLSDFDEIERYGINSKQLFKNLRDVKEIENWSFNAEQLTETQIKFMQFWEEIGKYYQLFNDKLEQQNSTYKGKAIQEITNNINWITNKFPNERFLFAGFNAHSPAELNIIKQLFNLGKAEILIDADQYYLSNALHEAGSFIKTNLKTLEIPEQLINLKDQLAKKSLDVQIVPCSQATGQVKVAATILEEMSEEQINETLVLLAEEDLLVPLLKNIPAKVGKANITLGLSLDNSILKTWMEIIFKVQRGLQSKSVAYHKDIFEIIYHPFVEEILSEKDKSDLMVFEHEFKINNFVYSNIEKLKLPEPIKPIFKLIYQNWNGDWDFGIKQIRLLNQLIYQQLKKTNEYEKALIETFDQGIIDFQNCVNDNFPLMNLSTFKNIFTQHYAQLTIAYFGNPIKGLQIMGLLETRMLDFKRIICIGMNEKNMPPNNQINSLIPMDLRAYFGLPTVREKQGIFAHHFYRLLHEVEELYITYSTSEGNNASEKSRYIMQMELELAAKNPNIQFNYRDYTISNQDIQIVSRQVEKDETVKKLLKEYFSRGLSASALGNFYRCGLDFFLKYILKFDEEIQIEEDIESSTFGILIHRTLEFSYKPFINDLLAKSNEEKTVKRIDLQNLELLKKHFEKDLNDSFLEHFKNKESYSSGRNRLNFEMAKKLLQNFFNYEIKRLPALGDFILIDSLERVLSTEVSGIQLANETEPITVKLNGIIDRIDYHNGGYHIIDYKSGSVDYKNIKLKDNFTEEDIYKICKKEKYFIQLYFYLYLFYTNFNTYPKSITFVSFVKMNDIESIEDQNEMFEKLILAFPKILERLLNDIYEDKPFKHEEAHFSYCTFCS